MNTPKNRTILFVLIMIVLVASPLLELSKIWGIYGLMGLGWLFFTGLANDIVERLTTSKAETAQTPQGTTYDLIAFNDAVAEELMRIRSDLVHIRLNQDNYCEGSFPAPLQSRAAYETTGEWLQAREHNDFFHLWLVSRKYSSSFLCGTYKAPDESRGRFIVVNNEIYPNEIFDDNSRVLSNFNSKELRGINSAKYHEFKKGMKIFMYLWESNEILFPLGIRTAKILSIRKDDSRDWSGPLVELEISLESCDEMVLGDKKEKIIRTVEMRNNSYFYFICDNE